jgi:hypothetical protein
MIDMTQYRLRAAIPFDNEMVYWTATNLHNGSASETPIDFEHSLGLFRFVYGENGDSQMELLRALGELDLVIQRGGTPCIVNSPELLPFGFSASELRF